MNTVLDRSEIKDIKLAESGNQKIEWVRRHCDLLRTLSEEFAQSKPFAGKRVVLAIHLEAKTALLCRTLQAGGAEVVATACNPLSTQDDICAALVDGGIEVHGWRGVTDEEYETHIRHALSTGPDIIIDDGGDLINMVHTEMTELIPKVIGGCEETTTGIHRLQRMVKAGELKFPMIMVNEAQCKHLFDNRYGTGQSVWDGINRTTNLIVAGKNVVVAGYGWCGKGAAMRAKGLGARVIVTEIDPVRAIEAVMDGFDVMPMNEAAKIGDFFVTETGCCGVIEADDFELMKDGVIVCNGGHFDIEIDVKWLKDNAVEIAPMRNNIIGYKLKNGNWINVIAEGRLVNLAAGDGHPAEIMDMSFAIQALSAKYLVEHAGQIKDKLIEVPAEIDREVALKKLSFIGKKIDVLTEEQKKYYYGE